MKRCVAVRRVGPIAIVALFSLLVVHATPARAGTAFDGPQAAGATFGAGAVAGMICWTLELGTQDRWRIEEEVEQRDDDFERTGWYGQLAGAYVLEFIDEGEEADRLQEVFPGPVDFELDSRHSGGIRVAVGRRCHERLAVEVEVEWIAPYEGSLDSADKSKLRDIQIAPVASTVNAKGYLLTGRIQPYLLAGVGVLSVSTESKNTADNKGGTKRTGQLAVRGGGGVDFYLNRNWVLNFGVDYLYSATNLEYLDFLTVSTGVQYRF
ncbi:MAG: OmpW family outer membrane protein [Myxococcota bacterium]|nr:OmpW family outer membrane protein [Myxococcota bacterium]